MKIGIFGGRFDPIHIGHLEMIRCGLLSHHFDLIHIIPSADPPHKPVLASFKDRCAMVKIAISHSGIDPTRVIIDPREGNRVTPSWSIDTRIELGHSYPEDTEFWLIIGDDTAFQLHTWRRMNDLLSMTHLLIIGRHQTEVSSLNHYIITHFPSISTQWVIDLSMHVPVSSTDLRQNPNSPYLPQHVSEYIHTHHLYLAPRHIVLGITGRVGSGKSAATTFLTTHFDIILIDLDLIGHHLLTLPDVQSELRNTFGDSIFSDGAINRKALGELVFKTPSKLIQLNQIMHPRIRQQVVNTLSRATSKPLVIVGALFEEIGILSLCTTIWVIDAEDTLIENAIGAKFNIRHSQKSRSAYKKQGVILTNSFDNRFFDTLNSEFIKLFGQN